MELAVGALRMFSRGICLVIADRGFIFCIALLILGRVTHVFRKIVIKLESGIDFFDLSNTI
ncbi:MAG: hypothetical protein V8T87_13140 [Victivallales bacterium]